MYSIDFEVKSKRLVGKHKLDHAGFYHTAERSIFTSFLINQILHFRDLSVLKADCSDWNFFFKLSLSCFIGGIESGTGIDKSQY